MRLSQADHQRLDRLAGDGSSVVGIDLAALFRVILNRVQDSQEPVTAEKLTEPVRDAVTNHARVEHMYGGNAADPWAALIGDALSQLELTGLAACVADGSWRPGPNFATGKRMVVIPARRAKHRSVGLTLYPAGEREVLGVAEKQRMEITSMAASMREDGRGLRPVNAGHVETLAQSMRDFGFRPELPVLVDKQGRVLDGRHRRAAARKAGVAEVTRVVDVSSDEEAVGFAILVNLQRGWTADERKRINADLQAAGLSIENFGQVMGMAAKRELIKAALLDNAELTHRAIAKRLSVNHQLVDHTCQALMDESSISECRHRLTEDGKQAPGRKPKAGSPFTPGVTLTPDQEEQVIERVARGTSAHAIHKELGVPTHAAQLAKANAEGRLKERSIQQSQALPPASADADVPEPATVSQPVSDQPSWQLMAELFSRLGTDDKTLFLEAIGAVIPS